MKGLGFIFLSLAIFALFNSLGILAKTDLSITATDITFSKDGPIEGEIVRIFARVFNLGQTDVYGFVVFTGNGKEIADPQPISVKVNTYDDVFIDWQAKAGTSDIQAKIINSGIADEAPENNAAVFKSYFVDLDTDKDGVGNAKDLDDDGDGLSDEREAVLGTNPLNPDTDGDKARDSIDVFPLDAKEWQDIDKDKIGDNADKDDDNDGLSDNDESFNFGTNPLNPDSDSDGLKDSDEIRLGTNALEQDTDSDGVNDSQDKFPLDPAKNQAAIVDAFSGILKTLNIKPYHFFGGVFLALVILAIIWRRRRK